MSKKLTGTGVALITPFLKNRKIDFKSLEKLIEHVIKGKVDFLVPLGTTGESVTLTKDEKSSVMDFVIKTNNKRLPIVMGLGGNNTQEIINQLQSSNFKNIDAILSVSPYYNKPSQKGLYQHFKAIADASPVPVILYNVPGRTGSNMLAETTLELAHAVKNIVGIKEASGNMEQCMKILKDRPKDFLVLSGDDAITLPLVALGADGVISVTANAFPKDFSELTRQAMQGNFEKARKLQYTLFEIFNLLFAEGSPAGIKAALNILNISEEYLRLPLVEISKATREKLTAAIKSY